MVNVCSSYLEPNRFISARICRLAQSLLQRVAGLSASHRRQMGEDLVRSIQKVDSDNPSDAGPPFLSQENIREKIERMLMIVKGSKTMISLPSENHTGFWFVNVAELFLTSFYHTQCSPDIIVSAFLYPFAYVAGINTRRSGIFIEYVKNDSSLSP